MLLDPRHDEQLKRRLLLLGLIAWLERQPADRKYWYPATTECVWGRFYQSRGQTPVSDPDWIVNGGNWIGYGGIAPRSGEWTFGAALARARAVLADPDGNWSVYRSKVPHASEKLPAVTAPRR